MRATAIFAAACGAVIALLGWLMTLVARTPAERHAVLVSAAVAVVVQIVGFAAVRAAGKPRLLAMWGAAAALRLLALVVYGLVVVLPPEAALLSLATFLFVTTLVESKLISI